MPMRGFRRSGGCGPAAVRMAPLGSSGGGEKLAGPGQRGAGKQQCSDVKLGAVRLSEASLTGTATNQPTTLKSDKTCSSTGPRCTELFTLR